MNYRSLDHLNSFIISNLWKIPSKTDLVVGIPRSGLLAANLLALHLNLPFTDLEGLLNGTILSSGQRLKTYKYVNRYSNVVILDDSILSGKTMSAVHAKVKQSKLQANVTYGAVFATQFMAPSIDFYFDICPFPRIFEWNIMHHDFLENSCVDLDGVLCRDPSKDENDDGVKYLQFVKHVSSLFKISKKIAYIVTNRLEKYRFETEEWLDKNGINYGLLVMSPHPTRAARLKANDYVEFKARVYSESGCILFIESCEWQARGIAHTTGKPVYCSDAKEMYFFPPSNLASTDFI